jgi:uncharacterized protein YjgD (DUF1641 family)
MARPISLEIPPRDPRQELNARFEQAPKEHVEALLDSYELLQQLHDRRIFAALRRALGAGDSLVERVMDAAKSPDAIAGMRNAIILGKMLASINPELLQGIAVAVATTLDSAKGPAHDSPGLFALLKQFHRRETRRSIGLLNQFLEALGNQLNLRGNTGFKH